MQDTVGAGNAYSVSFLCAYLSGRVVSKTTSFASIIGSYVGSKPGAVPEYSEELIKEFGILE